MRNIDRVLARRDEDPIWTTIKTTLRCGCCGAYVWEVDVSHIGERLYLECTCGEILCVGTLEELRALRVPSPRGEWARQSTIAPAFRRWLAAAVPEVTP
jgi:hypothetical protein